MFVIASKCHLNSWIQWLVMMYSNEIFNGNNFLFRSWGNKSIWLSWLIRKLCHCKLPISWKVFVKIEDMLWYIFPHFSHYINFTIQFFKNIFVLAYLSAINVLGRMRLDISNMQITTGQQFPAFHFPTTKKHIHKHARWL